MSNKFKKRVRALSGKTGLSYVGAVNQLRKGLKPGDVVDLYTPDLISRLTGALPIYAKDPDETAYMIGEEGETILAIKKPAQVIVPLFRVSQPLLKDGEYVGEDSDAVRNVLRERMLACLEASVLGKQKHVVSKFILPECLRLTGVNISWYMRLGDEDLIPDYGTLLREPPESGKFVCGAESPGVLVQNEVSYGILLRDRNLIHVEIC